MINMTIHVYITQRYSNLVPMSNKNLVCDFFKSCLKTRSMNK